MSDNTDILGSLFLNKTKKDGTACRPFIRGDLTIDGKIISVVGSLIERPAKSGGNVQYFLMSEHKPVDAPTPKKPKKIVAFTTGTNITELLGV